MSLAKIILNNIEKLPESAQAEVFDFVNFLTLRKKNLSDTQWKDLSLSTAMRGIENETSPEYKISDLKEKFR